MIAIKAIETRYKGYRFRSRLEARWAVFFDALGIKWEYEKEGYKLSTGWYLPDFWLPNFHFFVEIKPSSQGTWEHSRGVSKYEEDYTCILPVVLICGDPGDYEAFDYREGSDDSKWALCPKCGAVDFVYAGWAGYIRNCSCFRSGPKCRIDCNASTGIGQGGCCKRYKESGTDSQGMIKAINSARSARFEHGESPIP